MTRPTAHQFLTQSPVARRGALFGASTLAVALSLGACSEAPQTFPASGGSAAGGAVASGGAATSGGAANSGGAATSGGAANSGGAVASGGAASGGGGSAAGGSGSGGESPAGGSNSGGGGNTGGSASGGGGNEGPAFSEVAAIIGTKCGTAMCHGKSPMPSGGISLKNDAMLYDTLMAKMDIADCGGADLIVPSDAAASGIVKLIVGTECKKMGNAKIMPPAMANMPLPAADLDKIKAWIAAGAKE
jgi:hypothetical protein